MQKIDSDSPTPSPAMPTNDHACATPRAARSVQANMIATTDTALENDTKISVGAKVDAIPVNTDMFSERMCAAVMLFTLNLKKAQFEDGMPNLKHFAVKFVPALKQFIITGPATILHPLLGEMAVVKLDGKSFGVNIVSYSAPVSSAQEVAMAKRKLATWMFLDIPAGAVCATLTRQASSRPACPPPKTAKLLPTPTILKLTTCDCVHDPDADGLIRRDRGSNQRQPILRQRTLGALHPQARPRRNVHGPHQRHFRCDAWPEHRHLWASKAQGHLAALWPRRLWLPPEGPRRGLGPLQALLRPWPLHLQPPLAQARALGALGSQGQRPSGHPRQPRRVDSTTPQLNQPQLNQPQLGLQGETQRRASGGHVNGRGSARRMRPRTHARQHTKCDMYDSTCPEWTRGTPRLLYHSRAPRVVCKSVSNCQLTIRPITPLTIYGNHSIKGKKGSNYRHVPAYTCPTPHPTEPHHAGTHMLGPTSHRISPHARTKYKESSTATATAAAATPTRAESHSPSQWTRQAPMPLYHGRAYSSDEDGDGPSTTSPRVISKNLNGLQTGARYKNFLKHLAFQNTRQPIAAVMVQEHNLRAADREAHQRLAHHYRVLAVISYAPSEAERGGTAIFMPYTSIETANKEETLHEAVSRVAQTRLTALGGRLTRVTTLLAGTEVHPTAAYAPVAHGPLRASFMRRLRTHLTPTSILGIDANCVPDESLDLERASTAPYDNTGATELAAATAHFDLSDLAREQLGDEARYFTSHHHTQNGWCHSRIDQLYTPNVDGLLWTHAGAANFWAEGAIDHDALQATLTVPSGTRGRDLRRIDEAVFDDAHFNARVAAAINSSPASRLIDSAAANAAGTTIGAEWISLKERIVQLADEATDARKRALSHEAEQRDARIETLQHALSSGDASEHDIADLAALRIERLTQRREARSLFMETEEFAVKHGASHDTGRAAFYRQWTPRNAAQWVDGVMRADWTDPSKPVDRTTPATHKRDVADAFADYYKHLFAEKTPNLAALRDALDALASGNKVLPPTAARCAAAIDNAETEATCEHLPTGKSPGPDRLPNKFYVTFSKLISPILTAVFNEARDASARGDGGLPASMLGGIVSVLYKKNDRDDPRNYRPITLLNGDYKILMRILTSRMNEAVVQFVSAPQNGFVPNSFIAENLMLLKLLQAHIEEEQLDAMFLFADMEKAFDRASWAFMEQALPLLGLEDFLPYFRLAYSPDRPPTRQTYVNGYLSAPFPILSGVAQGCPISPLLFLLVTEVITRLITNDEYYKGITVDGTAHKISQFADDSTFLLSLGDEIRLAKHLETWCGATGMLENAKKREGMLLGALRRRPQDAPDIVPVGWLEDSKSIRALGVPMGNVFNETEWWLGRYRVVKRRVSMWKASGHLSLVGRNMLLQSYFYGSFRYWLFSLVLPVKVHNLIEEDAKELLWASTPELFSNEEGTEKLSRRFIHRRASHLARKQGGGSIMHWGFHVEAFYAQWGRRYLEPRQAPWKLVLDHWIGNRYHIGRGILLATRGAKERLWVDIPKHARYTRRCIKAFEDLNIRQDVDTISPDVLAEPLFNNNRFNVPIPPDKCDDWQEHLATSQLIDMLDEEGEQFADEGWEGFFYTMAPEKFRDKQRVHEWVEERKAELPALRDAIPAALLEASTTDPFLHHGAYVGVLKRDSPIRWAQVEVKDDGETTLHELWLDQSCKPHRTGGTVWWMNKSVIEASLWMERKERYATNPHDGCDIDDDSDDDETRVTIAGLRTSHFPADAGWFVDGTEPTKADGSQRRLSELTIRNISRLNTRLHTEGARPNCEANWENRIGHELPWPKIWRSLGTELSDATEESRWYRNLHRATFVRNRQDETSKKCRLKCGHEESMLHLPRCPKLGALWDTIFDFLNAIGIPPPAHRTEAILFNLWTAKSLGPVEARALIRLTFDEMYRRFALVDLADKEFDCTATALNALRALRRALIRRAAAIRKMHANRLHTSKPPVIPAEDAEKFPGLIGMSTDGEYTIAPALEAAISSQEERLKREREVRVEKARNFAALTKNPKRAKPARRPSGGAPETSTRPDTSTAHARPQLTLPPKKRWGGAPRGGRVPAALPPP